MSKAETTLDDFAATDDAEDEQTDDKRPEWTPNQKGSHSGADALECECGRPLIMWTAPATARQHVRLYGDEQEGTVPGCPGCVAWRDNDSERVESIPNAIREMTHGSTVEAHDHRQLVVKHARRRIDGR